MIQFLVASISPYMLRGAMRLLQAEIYMSAVPSEVSVASGAGFLPRRRPITAGSANLGLGFFTRDARPRVRFGALAGIYDR